MCVALPMFLRLFLLGNVASDRQISCCRSTQPKGGREKLKDEKGGF